MWPGRLLLLLLLHPAVIPSRLSSSCHTVDLYSNFLFSSSSFSPAYTHIYVYIAERRQKGGPTRSLWKLHSSASYLFKLFTSPILYFAACFDLVSSTRRYMCYIQEENSKDFSFWKKKNIERKSVRELLVPTAAVGNALLGFFMILCRETLKIRQQTTTRPLHFIWKRTGTFYI